MSMESSSPDLNHSYDTHTQKFAEKLSRRHVRKVLGIHATLLTAVSLVGSYWLDVAGNKEIQASSEASISVFDEPLNSDNNDSAIIFFNGFGTYDADPIAEVFGPGIKQSVDGESWSVSYGNAPLNSETIADKISTLAEERSVKTIDIVGYSAGGSIGIDTAARLAENTDLTIRSITTVSTPDGIEGLRPNQREGLAIADTLAAIPGAKYSTAMRFAGEVYFMRDRFDDGNILKRAGDFGETALKAAEHLQKPKLPGTWLLVDQTLAIADADIKSNLERIAEQYADKKPLPTLLYLGTAEPGRDYMVDNDLSSHRICGYGFESGMQCSIYNVPGAVHTMPHKTADEYTKTFAEASSSLLRGITYAQSSYEAIIDKNMLSSDRRLMSIGGSDPEKTAEDNK